MMRRKQFVAVVLAMAMCFVSLASLVQAQAQEISGGATEIKLTIGAHSYTLGGQAMQFDSPPFIEKSSGRTMVPIRFIAEGMGADVVWSQSDQTDSIYLGDKFLSIKLGQSLPNNMGMAALIDDRLFVPVRYVSEGLGAAVAWDAATQTVTITTNGGQVPKPAEPAPTAGATEFAERVITLVNEERAKVGLSPMTRDDKLMEAALYKCEDMAKTNTFSHDSPTYGDSLNITNLFNISWSAWGENIAQGQSTPEAVMKSWMGSAGHRANILSQNFSRIGVGYSQGLWTQEFTD
jgi:uncharacterized protein YkwD